MKSYTPMRTDIVIDDKSRREAVDEALRTLLRLKTQEKIRSLRGKLDWHGDLNAMRTDS